MAVRKRRNQWSDIDWDNVPYEKLSPQKKRQRLLKEAQYRCPQCGFDKQREDGGCILEIDHIDGDHKNNARENLRVLCPNCHALTPNFRNWGRSNRKTSSRIRRENKNYDRVRERILKEEQAYVENFKRTVMETWSSGEITYSMFGWVQRLADKLQISPQLAGRHVRKYLPDFYVDFCFKRGAKRLKK